MRLSWPCWAGEARKLHLETPCMRRDDEPGSAPWMVLRMQRFKSLARYVGVNRGGGNVSVAQKQLNGAQVGAVVKQMGGKSVAQGVR